MHEHDAQGWCCHAAARLPLPPPSVQDTRCSWGSLGSSTVCMRVFIYLYRSCCISVRVSGRRKADRLALPDQRTKLVFNTLAVGGTAGSSHKYSTRTTRKRGVKSRAL